MQEWVYGMLGLTKKQIVKLLCTCITQYNIANNNNGINIQTILKSTAKSVASHLMVVS